LELRATNLALEQARNERDQAQAALTARDVQAERDADATVRAAQESDQRAREATRELEAHRDLLAYWEGLARRRLARVERLRGKLRELETLLRTTGNGGGAGYWRGQCDNALAQRDSMRERMRTRIEQLSALEQAHRVLKRSHAAQAQAISRLVSEIEEAGLRDNPEGLEGTWPERCLALRRMRDEALERVRTIEGERDSEVAWSDHTRALEEELARLRGIIEGIAQGTFSPRPSVAAMVELRDLYAVDCSDAEMIRKACHEIRTTRDRLRDLRDGAFTIPSVGDRMTVKQLDGSFWTGIVDSVLPIGEHGVGIAFRSDRSSIHLHPLTDERRELLAAGWTMHSAAGEEILWQHPDGGTDRLTERVALGMLRGGGS